METEQTYMGKFTFKYDKENFLWYVTDDDNPQETFEGEDLRDAFKWIQQRIVAFL